jgi:signal transduction histidine kinase
MMHQNGLRLLKQINNLLDLAKLDAGHMELQYRAGNLSAILRGLVASVAPLAEKKRIVLIGHEIDPIPTTTYFDQERLEKVILNIVFNAIKFTNSGGRVDVIWGLLESNVLRVQVRDTGIGIAPEDLPKLFKRFSQVESGVNRRYEGTGIGLALAKEIVELHGGTIGVESQVARGTTMTFTVPILLAPPVRKTTTPDVASSGPSPDIDWTRELHAAAEHQMGAFSEESPSLTSHSLAPSNGVQVLVVEDNPDMREFVAFELQGDYRVLKATNGIEGVRVAGESLPDVIISDVMMPEMDGYQLCREIRKDPRTMHIPIILLTARAEMAMKIEGLEHGADDYLTKPFNAQELRAKIKALLEQRRLEREIQQRNEALEAALTELKNTQTQLVQSEKMAGLGLLVAGMAHEINNPINFAKNSLSVLERAWEDLKPLLAADRTSASAVEAVEDVDASLGIAKNGVTRTEQIVGQLKSFVRKDENQKVACSVQEGLQSTLELIRPMMGRQIVLHADLQSSGRVFAVPGKLNQVWMNLLQNAVQAVGSTGEIWVESRDHEHMVTVVVRDSGPGIKPEHMARLFEPFFTTKPVGQGTGLGLSVSYQIVQDAGGRIDVQSQPGQGAEFTVVLPLAQVLSQAA